MIHDSLKGNTLRSHQVRLPVSSNFCHFYLAVSSNEITVSKWQFLLILKFDVELVWSTVLV